MMDWTHLCLVVWIGQIFCLCTSSSGVFLKLLERAHLSTPIFNAFLIYCSLTIYFCVRKSRGTRVSIWLYLLGSVFDVLGLGFSILAFQHTLLASVSMIFVLSILSTTVFSIIFLNVKYFWNHYLAMLICAVGVIITVFTDLHDEHGNLTIGNGWGDLYAAISALSYGTTSVVIDYILRNNGNYFSMTAYLGLFGASFTGLGFLAFHQFFVFSNFSSYSDHDSFALFYYLAYVCAGFGIYTFNILLIQISTATVFHLILLCGTLYGMVYDNLLFDSNFKFWYVLGFILIILGMLLYYSKPSQDSKFQGDQCRKNLELPLLPEGTRI